MNQLTKDMLAVIKHGKPFTVCEDALRCGQVELVFHTRGAGMTAHFTLYNRNASKANDWPMYRSLYKGKSGFQIVLREFAKRFPNLQHGLLKPEYQNSAHSRMPIWQCYLNHAA